MMNRLCLIIKVKTLPKTPYLITIGIIHILCSVLKKKTYRVNTDGITHKIFVMNIHGNVATKIMLYDV